MGTAPWARPTTEKAPWERDDTSTPTSNTPAPKMAPAATMEARGPEDFGSWLQDAESDLRGGGGRTWVGRTLGRMEGRGDKGYNGLESGVGPGVAGFMGSIPLGAVKTAEGANDYWHGHPIRGGLKALGGELQMATLPLSFIAPEASASGTEIPTMLGIPNRAHAGKMLDEIGQLAEKAGTQVEPTGTMEGLNNWRKLMQAGGKPAGQKAIGSLEKLQLGTLAKPNEPLPMPWGDASLRYSNIAEQGREPVLQKLMGRGMTPKVRSAATGVQSGLRNDLSSAAESIGQGQKFEDAMAEYRRAAKMAKAARVAGGLLVGEAARRTGLLGNWIHRTALQQ